MATDDAETNLQGQDVNFLHAMHDMFDMDDGQVDEVLEKLSADELQELTDAVAKGDKDAAQSILNQSHSDDEVNALFRGKNLKLSQQQQQLKQKPADPNNQFAIGDDVMVKEDDESEPVSATVANPNGPEGTNTVIVKIQGKSTVVDKKNLHKLEETMVGMVGMPDLSRIRQLAGMRAQRVGDVMPQPIPQIEIEDDIEPLPDPDPAPDDPLAQAMSAFDTLEAALPNIQLADLKCVRERLTALQTSLNENRGMRARKI